MPYFEPAERKTEQLNVRITKTMREELKDLAEVWTAVAIAKTGDKEQKVTPGDAAVRLLEVGLDGAWGELGGRPKNAEEMKALLQQVAKRITK